MQNHLFSPQIRNKTLPLKHNHQIRSANKIKISMKGLPKDFFHSEAEQYFIKPKQIRCRTQAASNEFEETSYFQHHGTLEPKRQGREYKSEQRQRSSKKRLLENYSENERADPYLAMNYTFFKSIRPANKSSYISGNQGNSDRNPRKANDNQQSVKMKDLQTIANKSDLNNLFKAREIKYELNFHKPRANKSRGPLPLIRLSKRTAN